MLTNSATTIGSSPRARGAARCLALPLPSYRFIPACAGSSHGASYPESARTVHPRVRGEQPDLESVGNYYGGSSPRARGAAVKGGFANPQLRFIPACAGSSDDAWLHYDAGTVHPRVRGEQPNLLIFMAGVSGSSPRARGAARHWRQTG